MGNAIGCGLGGPPRAPIDAGEDGTFDLGTHVERGWSGYEMWSTAYLTEGRNTVVLHADDKIGVDTTFVGVAARMDELVARVTTPDGTPLVASTAKTSASCEAVAFQWTPPADAWRTVPVHVKVVRDGCEPLAFDWTAATADAQHVLVPK